MYLNLSPQTTDENGEILHLDELILGVPKGTVIIHLNGNPLDCRKANLKVLKGEINENK